VLLKVLNCDIGFQGLKKVLNLAKMTESMEIPNSAIHLFTFSSLSLMTVADVFSIVFHE